ncbi:MAG: hypothetical protein HYT76_01365 [Deltaproteobacteria bacterium]|nr:hypothetical protein [Deltaproteobacteria bacterium]
MSHAILMGDPTHFHISGGANPFTRDWWGRRKFVDQTKAAEQWRQLARVLTDFGIQVFVIPSSPNNPGLVYPANAGFLSQLEEKIPIQKKKFILSNLLPSRAGECPIYRDFLRGLGFAVVTIKHRFEGEAELFPVGSEHIFTYGGVVKQRFTPKLGLPPWKRVYGFRTERDALQELRPYLGVSAVHDFELLQESHYHGDTIFCSFGEKREFLLVYLEGLAPESRERCVKIFGDRLIPLSTRDAFFYATNSFQVRTKEGLKLIVPEGASHILLKEIETRGVQPFPINVSEFLKKGGGAVKCMIGDLGELIDETSQVTPSIQKFREEHLFR